MRRVVVTGAGGISALGNDWNSIERGLRARRNAVRYMPEWDRYTDLNTRLAAPCDGFEPPEEWTRKQLRSLGRVSQLAVRRFVVASFDYGTEVLRNLTQDLLTGNVTLFGRQPHTGTDVFLRAYMHTAHHRGQIVVYLRVRGITPPAWQFEPTVA